MENKWWHKNLDHIKCHDTLKKLVLSFYDGNNESHVEFAKFFILNGRALQSMKLDVERRRSMDKKWIENQLQLLQPKGQQVLSDVDINFDYLNFSVCPKKDHELLPDPFEHSSYY